MENMKISFAAAMSVLTALMAIVPEFYARTSPRDFRGSLAV